jgi:hypothetical protein
MSQVRPYAAFYKVAGVCSIGSGLTTLAVHLVPLAWSNVTTLEQQVGLRSNPLYLSRLWMVYLHLLLVVIAMVGVALRKIRVAPGAAILGLIGYVFFAFAESIRVSLALFALNASWRTIYASTADEAIRASMRTLLLSWPGLNDALFVLFSLGFAAGNFFYGAATWKSRGTEKAVSISLLIWALIGVYGLAQGHAGASWLPPPPEWLSYTFQPAVRLLIGAWLLQPAPEDASPAIDVRPARS